MKSMSGACPLFLHPPLPLFLLHPPRPLRVFLRPPRPLRAFLHPLRPLRAFLLLASSSTRVLTTNSLSSRMLRTLSLPTQLAAALNQARPFSLRERLRENIAPVVWLLSSRGAQETQAVSRQDSAYAWPAGDRDDLFHSSDLREGSLNEAKQSEEADQDMINAAPVPSENERRYTEYRRCLLLLEAAKNISGMAGAGVCHLGRGSFGTFFGKVLMCASG